MLLVSLSESGDPVWRVRLLFACGLVVAFTAMAITGLLTQAWTFTAALTPFLVVATVRVWLMHATEQPVPFLATAVILLRGPRQYIASNQRRGHREKQL